MFLLKHESESQNWSRDINKIQTKFPWYNTNLLSLTDLVYLLFTPNRVKKGNCYGHRRKLVFKGTIMQIEKAKINDGLSVSKVSWKFRIPTVYNFGVIYPSNLQYS